MPGSPGLGVVVGWPAGSPWPPVSAGAWATIPLPSSRPACAGCEGSPRSAMQRRHRADFVRAAAGQESLAPLDALDLDLGGANGLAAVRCLLIQGRIATVTAQVADALVEESALARELALGPTRLAAHIAVCSLRYLLGRHRRRAGGRNRQLEERRRRRPGQPARDRGGARNVAKQRTRLTLTPPSDRPNKCG
jgi:hypothetical protein